MGPNRCTVTTPRLLSLLWLQENSRQPHRTYQHAGFCEYEYSVRDHRRKMEVSISLPSNAMGSPRGPCGHSAFKVAVLNKAYTVPTCSNSGE